MRLHDLLGEPDLGEGVLLVLLAVEAAEMTESEASRLLGVRGDVVAVRELRNRALAALPRLLDLLRPLTPRGGEAARHVLMRGRTLAEAGRLMGTTRQAVFSLLPRGEVCDG